MWTTLWRTATDPGRTLPLPGDIRGSFDRVSVPGFSLLLLGFRAIRTWSRTIVLEGSDTNLHRAHLRAPAHRVHRLHQVVRGPPEMLCDGWVLNDDDKDPVTQGPGLRVGGEALSHQLRPALLDLGERVRPGKTKGPAQPVEGRRHRADGPSVVRKWFPAHVGHRTRLLWHDRQGAATEGRAARWSRPG